MQIELTQGQAKCLLEFAKKGKEKCDDTYGEIMGVVVYGTTTQVEATNGNFMIFMEIEHDDTREPGRYIIDYGDVKRRAGIKDASARDSEIIPVMEDYEKLWPRTDHIQSDFHEVADNGYGIKIPLLKRAVAGITHINKNAAVKWESGDLFGPKCLTGTYQDGEIFSKYRVTLMPCRID